MLIDEQNLLNIVTLTTTISGLLNISLPSISFWLKNDNSGPLY